MEHPVQTYNVEYAVPMESSSFYGSYYPAAVPQQ
jgi:hypothetical protein